MRKFIVLIVVLIMIMPVLTVPAKAISTACQYASYHPGFAYQCFMEIMMDLWGSLGWDDDPAGSAMMGGDAASVQGDGDDVTGTPGDGDDVTG